MDPRERERQEEKARERKALLDRAYDRVVASQLQKLASKKTITGESMIICCVCHYVSIDLFILIFIIIYQHLST